MRELARIGNNLNQLARAANRHEPVTATALLSRLIEIDRELAALRAANTRSQGMTELECKKNETAVQLDENSRKTA